LQSERGSSPGRLVGRPAASRALFQLPNASAPPLIPAGTGATSSLQAPSARVAIHGGSAISGASPRPSGARMRCAPVSTWRAAPRGLLKWATAGRASVSAPLGDQPVSTTAAAIQSTLRNYSHSASRSPQGAPGIGVVAQVQWFRGNTELRVIGQQQRAAGALSSDRLVAPAARTSAAASRRQAHTATQVPPRPGPARGPARGATCSRRDRRSAGATPGSALTH
jgi:hypothetical protein